MKPAVRAPEPELPHLLTPAEVAVWLSTTREAIYARAERGALPGIVRLGRRLFFDRRALLQWVEQGCAFRSS